MIIADASSNGGPMPKGNRERTKLGSSLCSCFLNWNPEKKIEDFFTFVTGVCLVKLEFHSNNKKRRWVEPGFHPPLM